MQEQDDDIEPAHHARRPMNAFLIFCKRHRSVVRDKYPNLENRSITKILGEWWANLDKDEKACYTGLAKQYKDAFFSANPDFKWYKLPAPPLRTLSSRPREPTEKHDPTRPDYAEMELEKTNNNSTKVDFNNKPIDHDYDNVQKHLSMFTPGKLADEAQMGGISSLLATKTETQTPNPYYSPPTYKPKVISTFNDNRSHNVVRVKPKMYTGEDNIRELQNALSETTRMFEEDSDAERGAVCYYEIPNEQLTNQDVINRIVENRYSSDDYSSHRNWSDDERNTKSGRSCKGKRYQEFMAVGGLIVNKRQRRDYSDKTPDDSYSASCSWEPGSHNEEIIATETDDTKQQENVTNDYNDMKTEANDTPESDNNTNKTFKAADFDLDAKIRALPSLSLEKFQQKKRENKKKKKTLSAKSKVPDSPQIINSVPRPVDLDDRRAYAENWREQVIGSQKRKPRKISITRLEINSMVSSVNMAESHKISPEIKIATEAPQTVVQHMDICNPPSHNHIDLFALATLAEVAANTSKLEEKNFDNISAKVSDNNAPQV